MVHGKVKLYNEEENIEAILGYKEGLRSGDYIFYFPNGNIKERGAFKNNKLQGLIETYNENKELVATAEYVEGNFKSGKCSNGKSIFSEDVKRDNFNIHTFCSYN